MNRTLPTRSIDEVLSPGILAELRRLELKTRRAIDSDLVGNYRSAFRGSGLVFSDLREYIPGDDVKHIHWNATARTGKVFVKSFEEDRQVRVFVAVDISNSTNFGTGKIKHLKALEFAAVIAMLAQKNHDLMGLCLFSDVVEEFLPPAATRKQFHEILLSILRHRELRKGTDVGGALSHIREHLRRPSVLFVVSDFLSPPFADQLRMLSLRHDVICVLLEDRTEQDPPRAGIVQFYDAESGRRVLIDTSSAATRRRITGLHAQRLAALRELCSACGADLMRVQDSVMRPLADLMQRRQSRYR
jgi:uncharacterized protein (DUF58 family)